MLTRGKLLLVEYRVKQEKWDRRFGFIKKSFIGFCCRSNHLRKRRDGCVCWEQIATEEFLLIVFKLFFIIVEPYAAIWTIISLRIWVRFSGIVTHLFLDTFYHLTRSNALEALDPNLPLSLILHFGVRR